MTDQQLALEAVGEAQRILEEYLEPRVHNHERVLDNWLRFVNLADLVLARSTISKNNHRRAQLWRLRRAITIESGLFKIQAKHLLQFRQLRQLNKSIRRSHTFLCPPVQFADLSPR
jgi:hypothetical protein